MTVHGPDEFDDVVGYRLREKIAAASFVCCIGHYARSQVMRLSSVEHWEKLEVTLSEAGWTAKGTRRRIRRNIRTTGSTVFWASDSPSAVSYTYNGSGQVTGVSETVDGYPRTTAYTYNSDGTVNTEAVTWHGVTRTRTYSYSNGQCTGSTEV